MEYDLAVLYRHPMATLGRRQFNVAVVIRCLVQAGYTRDVHYFPMRDRKLKRTNRMLVVGRTDDIAALHELELPEDYFRIERFRWQQHHPCDHANGVQFICPRWSTRERAQQMAREIIGRLTTALPTLKYRSRVFRMGGAGKGGGADKGRGGGDGDADKGSPPAPEPAKPPTSVHYKVVMFMDNYPWQMYRLVIELAKTFPYLDYTVVHSVAHGGRG